MSIIIDKIDRLETVIADLKTAIEAKTIDLTGIPLSGYPDKLNVLGNTNFTKKLVMAASASEYAIASTRTSVGTYTYATQNIWWRLPYFLLTGFGWELPADTYDLYLDGKLIATTVWDASDTYCMFTFDPILITNMYSTFKIVKHGSAVSLRSASNLPSALQYLKTHDDVFWVQWAYWNSNTSTYPAPIKIIGKLVTLEDIT